MTVYIYMYYTCSYYMYKLQVVHYSPLSYMIEWNFHGVPVRLILMDHK